MLFVLTGCTSKQLISKADQESAFIIIKTPTMKYADMGFIYKSDALVKIEIYSMGQPLIKFDINAMNVCMSTFECMEKKEFNAKMLHASYPETLLENIFKAQPIFNQEGLTKSADGFSQKIQKDNQYNITYSIVGKKRTFRDTINKIVIKVKPQ